MSTIKKITIENFIDSRGNLVPIEKSDACLPFHPVRTYCIVDVPAGVKRAGHANNYELFMFALKGSVKLVHTDHYLKKQEWVLNASNFGLYIPPMQFIELVDFEKDTALVVLASKNFCDAKHYTLEETIARRRENSTD
jgi:dTDP-4-dehydrorhamnose 3,5-epimerase-like enzyme